MADFDAYAPAPVQPGYMVFGCAGGNAVAPVISNVTPTAGTALAGTYLAARRTPVTFDVTDDLGELRLVLVTCKYTSSDMVLVVHDGSNFCAPFNVYSTRTAITDGYAFSILPNGGWASAMQLFVYTIDQSGNLEGSLP